MFGYSGRNFSGLGNVYLSGDVQIELERLRDAISAGP